MLNQLKNMVDEMRRIPPPGRTIGDFDRYLRGGLEVYAKHKPERFVSSFPGKTKFRRPLVFTHGDLSSLNVLASGEEIVGIVDWETAAWYPSYWEYTTAWHGNPQNQFWRDEVDEFLEPMPKELEMERIRLAYFGDV
ncbi:hypothetical protein ACEQ8H_001789 [Pleosporales sp. CAS-2024a]